MVGVPDRRLFGLRRSRRRPRTPDYVHRTGRPLCDHGNYARGLAEIAGQGSWATGYRREVGAVTADAFEVMGLHENDRIDHSDAT